MSNQHTGWCCNDRLSWQPLSETERFFRITVANRDYHYLSQSEIGGAKRISQYLYGPNRPASLQSLVSDYAGDLNGSTQH